MLAVAGGPGDLLLSRDAHKSVVAGLVFSGTQPQWIRPRYDARLHLAHPPSPERVARGSALTGASIWASATTAASRRPCQWPMTTRQPPS